MEVAARRSLAPKRGYSVSAALGLQHRHKRTATATVLTCAYVVSTFRWTARTPIRGIGFCNTKIAQESHAVARRCGN